MNVIKKLVSKKIILYFALLNIILVSALLFLTKNNGTSILSPLGETVQVINAFISKKPTKTVYGYLPYWMMGNAKYLEYDKLTDISYFGLKVTGDGTFDTSEQGYKTWENDQRLQAVIKKAKLWNVRFSVTIINQTDSEIDDFLNCDECWSRLYSNLRSEMYKHQITDVNIDFEHTTETTDDIANKYTDFVAYIKRRLTSDFPESKLVVASFADSYKRNRITKPDEIAKVADGIFIMAYDFHQPGSENAGPVAPIYSNGLQFDVKKTIEAYKKQIPPEKLILGVPYYGYNFLIQEQKPDAERLPGNDNIGYTVSQYYAMIMDSEKIPKESVVFDSESSSPYIIYRNPETLLYRVLHFENIESLEKKYNLAIDEGLQGVGIWALGYDGDYKELWNLLGKVF